MAQKKKQSTPPRDKQQRPTVVKAGTGKVVVEGKKAEVRTVDDLVREVAAIVDVKTTKGPRPYEVLLWKGQELYQCLRCPYNAMVLSELMSHVVSRHGPRLEPTGLVSPTGLPLTKEV
jgi:hypothetical protein